MDPIRSGFADARGFRIQLAVRRRRKTSDKDRIGHNPWDLCWQQGMVQEINFQPIDSAHRSLDIEAAAIDLTHDVAVLSQDQPCRQTLGFNLHMQIRFSGWATAAWVYHSVIDRVE